MAETRPYSVTEITSEIKSILDGAFPTLWVHGELSNYVHHRSGHRYFSLKDENAQIRCVLWRWQGSKLAFEPEDGLEVMAWGDITVYEPQGQHQLVVSQLVPAGLGELKKGVDALKEKLDEEGLTAQERKRALPGMPQKVGVVTSPTGAAIRDILTILGRRMPWGKVIVRPALVQGVGAAEDIAQAIEELNEHGEADVLIVGRGGGSLEDLAAFNEERVARAIAASSIPIVSAVGHEVDVTIADLVADLRAATPSVAAEMVAPDRAVILEHIDRMGQDLTDLMTYHHDRAAQRLDYTWDDRVAKSLVRTLQQRKRQMSTTGEALCSCVKRRLMSAMAKSNSMAERLNALSPLGVMKRGYAAVSTYPEGEPVGSASLLSPGDTFRLTFGEDALRAKVEELFKTRAGSPQPGERQGKT